MGLPLHVQVKFSDGAEPRGGDVELSGLTWSIRL